MKMRHKRSYPRIYIALSLVFLLCLCLFMGCTNESGDTNDTESNTQEAATVEDTDAVTTETQPNVTTKFNQGIVDYEILIESNDGEVQKTVIATPVEGHSLGLDITDKTGLVSICYSVWFDYILGQGSEPVTDFYNITEVLNGNQTWGDIGQFHYWAKPAQGYYRSTDKTAIRNNMTMINNAGVDFIILDHTNLADHWLDEPENKKTMIDDPMIALFDTIMEMRAEGLGTPYVVIWCGNSDGPMYRYLYDSFYNVEKWKDCFVYWEGKPFFLTTHKKPEEFPLKDLFTVRSMWGLSVNYDQGQWCFLSTNNHNKVTYGPDGTPEQISVATASQESYMSDFNTAHGRQGGLFWYAQWRTAFAHKPKIVTLTWWNEWAAQRFDLGNGAYTFVDNYNADYSRDIEPMEGGHGDQYYRWMIQYISAYKGGLECPVLIEERYERELSRFIIKYERGKN